MNTRWSRLTQTLARILIAAAALLIGTYIVASVLGYPDFASALLQWVPWVVVACVALAIARLTVFRNGRSAARSAANASTAEVNALLLGTTPPTPAERSEHSSAYPPDGSTRPSD